MIASRLQIRNPAGVPCGCGRNGAVVSSHRRLNLRQPSSRHFASFTVQSVENASSKPSVSSELTCTIGSSSVPHPSQWTLTQRHINFLSFVACAAAISATWLFCSAIPTLLAFKRAAESLEKLMDATREELPDTMAAVRLSGMEISDLTMELSDLGQEITQGVRNSTRAVRSAEERLRRLTNMNPIVSVQEVAPTKPQIPEPVLARTARNVREGIVKGRAFLQMFFTITRYSKILLNYFISRAKA
ncbi:hypothetical protein CDL12_13572 [Handroanthus impetiginosus]|uniref:Transmembrane protein n=1 Tax=Handroanthus impetiginosus TaxID=429701 RepID=A0A2G9H8F1_9LAMI|nr:hypothetical protein CDL12_13572 [Handroanthus impetiginosus]